MPRKLRKKKVRDKDKNKITTSTASCVTLLAATDSPPDAFHFEQKSISKEYDEKAQKELKRAASGVWSITPNLIMTGLQASQSGFFSFFMKEATKLMEYAGLIHRSSQASVVAVDAIEDLIKAGYHKIKSIVTKDEAERQQIKEIYESFISKLIETINLIIMLNLETTESIKNIDIPELIALTLLNTAYHSRNYENSILLHNDKLLTQKNCPSGYFVLFYQVTELSKLISDALRTKNQDPKEAKEADAKKAFNCLKTILVAVKTGIHPKSAQGNKVSINLTLVNRIIKKINVLKETAIDLLPEEPEKLISRLGK